MQLMVYINENFVMTQRNFEIDWEVLLIDLEMYLILIGDMFLSWIPLVAFMNE